MCVVSVCVVRCVISELHSCGRQLLGGLEWGHRLFVAGENGPFCAEVGGSGRTIMHFYLLETAKTLCC